MGSKKKKKKNIYIYIYIYIYIKKCYFNKGFVWADRVFRGGRIVPFDEPIRPISSWMVEKQTFECIMTQKRK